MHSRRVIAGLAAAVAAQAAARLCFGQAFVGQNFAGGAGATIALQPPDTDGAAGVDHYIQFINGRFIIANKGTGATISSVSSLTFWNNAGVTFGNDSRSDPRISYDPLSGRWFTCQIDVINGSTSNSNNFLLGVSNTSDPTQGFKGFKFSIGSNFGDFPTLGVNAQGVYLSTNNFPLGAGDTTPPTNTTIVSIPKSDLLLATPTIAHKTQYTAESLDTRGNVIQPIVNFSPSATHEPLLGIGNGTVTTQLIRTDLNNSAALVAGGATLSTSVSMTVPTASQPPLGQQPSGTIDSIDIRLGSVAYQVGSSIWAAECVSFGGRAAVRWYQVDEPTNTVLQAGTISAPNFDFVAPSVCANTDGDVVIGYTRTSSSTFPQCAVSVGTTSLGVTNFAAPQVLKSGTNTFTGSRWGDYSATSPDVTDPGIFWTTQEWATSGSNNWATQVTEVIPNKPGEVRWMSPANGVFSSGTNWFGGAAPTSGSHAIFSRSTLGTGYTVTIGGVSSLSLDRLSLRQGNATINLGGATLSVNNSGATTPSIAVGEFGGNPSLVLTSGSLNSVNTTIAASATATGSITLSAATWNNSGSIFVGGSSSAAGGAGSLIVNSSATLTVGGTLKAWNAGNVKIASPTRVGDVSAVGNGKIDLTNSAMAVDYTGSSPLAGVGALLLSGYAGGAWAGPGINSSTAALPANLNKTAVGYGEASDIFTSFPATFAGLTIDNSTVLVRYTLYGDANLDTSVDTVDFNIVAAHFGQSGTIWDSGDFNYSGTTDTIDFNLLAANFSLSLPAQARSAAAAVIPEPTGLVACIASCLMLRRCRRKPSNFQLPALNSAAPPATSQ